MATRNGGGVYIAFCKGYPTCDNVVLWKYGTTKLLKVPNSQGASHVAISPAPSGRLWVAFEDEDDNLHAVRSNTTAKQFGAVRTLERPKSAGSVYKIQQGKTERPNPHDGAPGISRSHFVSCRAGREHCLICLP